MFHYLLKVLNNIYHEYILHPNNRHLSAYSGYHHLFIGQELKQTGRVFPPVNL